MSSTGAGASGGGPAGEISRSNRTRRPPLHLRGAEYEVGAPEPRAAPRAVKPWWEGHATMEEARGDKALVVTGNGGKGAVHKNARDPQFAVPPPLAPPAVETDGMAVDSDDSDDAVGAGALIGALQRCVLCLCCRRAPETA